MGSEQTMSLFNYFKKVNKSASCAFKEIMKDLEPDAISSTASNVDLTANEKKSVSYLIENAEFHGKRQVSTLLCLRRSLFFINV